MSAAVIPTALMCLAVIGTGLFLVAVKIYTRLGVLIDTIADLRRLAVGSQGELVQAKEGIGRMHSDLGRLVATTNVASQLVRGASRLPQR